MRWLKIVENVLNPILNKTANDYSTNPVVKQFQNHAQNIKKLQNDYNSLKVQAESAYNSLTRLRQLQNTMDSEEYLSPQAVVNIVYRNKVNQRQTDEIVVKQYLDNLKKWGILAYSEIVSFREFITNGQQLQYDIEDGQTHLYRLNEEQYLEMLSGKNANLFTRNQKWDKVTPDTLAEILSLQIVKPLNERFEYTTFIGRSKDSLQRFIYDNYSKQKYQNEKIYDSRLFEIYSQVRYKVFSDFHKENLEMPIPEDIFAPKENETRDFINSYIDAKMHKDNIAFYKMGDSIENANVLIENKRVGAGISIRTIKNAIEALYELVNTQKPTKAFLRSKLNEIYIQQGKSTFEKSITDGAAKKAKEGIEDILKQMDRRDIKFIFT
ncbi:hypothetical protein IJ384_07195 [bacterium]|nr:hypothetical protein [bacterium]